MATSPEEAFLQDWLPQLCASRGIAPQVASAPEGVETTVREKDGTSYLFVLNHNAEAASVSLGDRAGVDLLSGRTLSGEAELPGRDLWIVKLDR